MIVGISVYNSPANRLSRQLDLGQKYLVEQNYEQAIVEFDKAIAIDPMNADAYLGKADAYIGMGDYDNAIETLKNGRDATDGNADIMDKLAEAYLGKAETYEGAGDYDNAIRTLEEAYRETDQNAAVKAQLVEDYLITTDKKTGNAAYAESLKDYDRLLELDKGNEKVISGLSKCLVKYLDALMEEGRYDEVRALVQKYRDVATGVDFDKYLNRIAELEKIKAENDAFMQKVYELMAAKDYDAMYGMDGSEEADTLVAGLEGDRYIYFPDGNVDQTGTGAGVYLFGEGGYYFFYGTYKDGSREGDGVIYMKKDGDGEYYLFTGKWENDAPNGPGIAEIQNKYRNSGDSYYTIREGNLVNGLWDGEVKEQVTTEGIILDCSFSATVGIPTEDKTQEFVSQYGNPGFRENEYVYAYGYYSDATKWRWTCSVARKGATVGVVGFSDAYT